MLDTVHVQPDPQEIRVQAMSAVAAGAKGLMWFQSALAEADHDADRWDAIAFVNASIRGVRHLLRAGDPTGLASTEGAAIVEAIRTEDALVVPVINLAAESEPTALLCAGSFVLESTVPHWVLGAQTLDLEVDVPSDLAVTDIFEVRNGELLEISVAPQVDGRTITIPGVELSNALPTRLFVLAADSSVRARVQSELAP